MSQRFIVVTVVLLAAPFVVGLARASFAPAAATPAVARDLTAIAEPAALARRYGVAVVAMREPPMADDRQPATDDRAPTTDNRLPTTDAFLCPEVRAIVTGDARFAILAWGDASLVAVPGKSLSSPAGEVMVRRVGVRSVSLSRGDVSLNCQLSMR